MIDPAVTPPCQHVHADLMKDGDDIYRQCPKCRQKFKAELIPWDGKVEVTKQEAK